MLLSQYEAISSKNNWFIYETEDGGVFNPEQLAKFSTVIFDNSTGEVINDEQKRALEQYVENGGGLIGIHGAGDDSHHWDWYEQNLLGAKFSHHALAQQFQTAEIQKDIKADSTISLDYQLAGSMQMNGMYFLRILVLKVSISSILWMEIK
jgi:type 1 glutamine amidotransferase